MGSNTLLLMENVDKKYGDIYALQAICLQIEKGEWVSIMGPSGSGKTTLLNIISCLDRPSSGQVALEGREVSGLTERELAVVRRERIGLVFQQFHLVPYLTALENVMLAQYYHSLPDEKEARTALKRIGLEHRADHLPFQLSGGEKQRACIARALINHPALLLADEPTGNLDAANEKLVLELFQELHCQGHTLLVVTHDQEVAELAQRRVTLEHGRIVAECG